MAEYRLISADSHFVEPPTMWAERIDKKFRDRAPHTVKGLNGREGEWFVCENITPMSVAGFFGAGVPSLVIGVPVRYIHTHAAIMHRDDFDNAAKLLVAVVKPLCHVLP